MAFTNESVITPLVNTFLMIPVQQCVASVLNLGLVPLAPVAPVLERQRQIAIKLGISLGVYNYYYTLSYLVSDSLFMS